MKSKEIVAIVAVALGLMVWSVAVSKAEPMGTAFTYQGRLMDANFPADGEYDLQFKLFDDANAITGHQLGTTIDINDFDVIDGYFTVGLDFGSDVFDGNAVWLEVGLRPGDMNDPNSYTVLSSRQQITAAPYALKVRGIFVDDACNVGIGTTGPTGRLHVDGGKARDDSDGSNIVIKAQDGGDARRLGSGRRGGDIILQPGEGGAGMGPPYPPLSGPPGRVGIGTDKPEATLDVRGNIEVDQKIQAHDAGGLQFATDEGTTRIFVEDGGKVGIGTTTPRASLEVINTGSSHAIWASTSDIPVYALRTGTSGTWPAVNGDCNSASSGASGVRGRILSTNPGSLGAGVYGYNYGTGSNGVGVRGYHDGSGYGVYGHTAGSGIGVYGLSNSSYGVYGVSSSGYGVRGYNSSSGHYGNLGGSDYGVYGEVTGDSAERCAVYGRDNTSANIGYLASGGMGVYGYSFSGDGVYGHSFNGYAGYFRGDVRVTGNLTKGGGSFKIDHPLDPENKYLQHSFVESPDMMNVYNGNVVLNKDGESSVQLPEYFEALNGDFRYQLTCIGGFAPVYIAEEIDNNRFKIAGGKAGMKVSWQVTGIRNDAYAKVNRIAVEENKSAEERGYYLHPAAYGLPKEKGIEAVHNARFPETRQVAKKVD